MIMTATLDNVKTCAESEEALKLMKTSVRLIGQDLDSLVASDPDIAREGGPYH